MKIFLKGVGDANPIHNFGTHLLCTKSYGILGEKRGVTILEAVRVVYNCHEWRLQFGGGIILCVIFHPLDNWNYLG